MCTVMEGDLCSHPGSGGESPKAQSPDPSESQNTASETARSDSDDDEISVGCPSPPLSKSPRSPMTPDVCGNSNSNTSTLMDSSCSAAASPPHATARTAATDDEDYFKPLKKLKMMQIKHHQPSPSPPAASGRNGVKSFTILDILSHRPVRKAASEPVTRIVRPWDLGAKDPERRRRPKSADCDSRSESDCPDSPAASSAPPTAGSSGTSPLDALFQMTSKTFEGLNGNNEGDGQSNHLNLFNNRQQPKKKRKSRTAFTNHQIFELEKRFLYQKYLSPADRDEIAQQLGLTNAQVITWFQNRRAKQKRDMEELKGDVESAKILTAHTSFLQNVQEIGMLKKKVDDKSSASEK